MPRENKATKDEVQKRVDLIFEYLTKGISSAEIFQYITEKHDWNLSERQVRNYIQKANLKYSELAEKHKDVEFGKAISRLTMLFQKSLKIQDFKTCLQVQKEINQMFGNYEAQRFDHTTNGKEINSIFKGINLNLDEPKGDDSTEEDSET